MVAVRDEHGKFVKGNPGSPGRKTNQDHQSLKEVLAAAVSAQERIDIFRTLTRNAIAGDTRAAGLVLAYLYGKPKENIEVSDSRENQPPMQVVINAPRAASD